MKIKKIVTGTFCTAYLFGAIGVLQAANFTVDDALDGADINPGDGLCVTSGNSCTLRAAIMETNALPGADTITLPAGLYTLALGNTGEDAAAEGDLDILDDLTITGADAATTTVNGNSFLYRIFSVLERTDNTLPTVNISNITLTQGLADIPGSLINDGALIQNRGNLTLDNVILTDANPDNYAMVSNGNLTVTNSQIINNSAGIYSESGNVEISGTTFNGNNGGNSVGGPLVINSGSVHISTSSFSNNIAYDLGGAIFQRAGELVIDNSSFSGNTVTASPNTFRANGGAIASRGGTLEVTNSSFDNNNVSALGLTTTAGTGGAIIITGTDFAGIDNSTFTNNTSSGVGGAIYVDEGGTGLVFFRRITVDGNSSDSFGGGVFVGGGLLGQLAEKVVISESIIINNTANVGGGIAFAARTSSSSDLDYQFTHSEISGNTADQAGGIYSRGNGIVFQNLTISNNSATTNGGGFYQEDGSNELNQVTIANNSSPAANGSNIENNSGTLNINHIIVDNPLGGGNNCVGTITSMGSNIVSDASCGLGVSGDQANTAPLLAPLADNGGFSKTLALQAGSPAINAGSATFCNSVNPIDQRYFYRGDTNCDVGAFEAGSSIAQSGTLAFTSTDFTVTEDVGTASITLSRSSGSQGDVALYVFDNRQGTATPGSDYTSVPLSIIEWPDGDSSNKTLDIAISDDLTEESSETIQLQIESSAFVTGGASIGTSTTTLIINANDAPTTSTNTNTGGSSSTSSEDGSSGAFHPFMLLSLLPLIIIRRSFNKI